MQRVFRLDSKGATVRKSRRSSKMLQKEYFPSAFSETLRLRAKYLVAKLVFDTAENDPSIFLKILFDQSDSAKLSSVDFPSSL